MKFVDANIILRYLTQDDPVKAHACFEFFRRLEHGEDEATTCEAIIAEVVYVLGSPRLYHLTPDEIRARLAPLLALKGLKLRQKRLYLKALDLRASHPTLDFEDALAIAHMEQAGISEILSYDHGLSRIPEVKRIEP
jgi:predicted nucleic acid-binding protein